MLSASMISTGIIIWHTTILEPLGTGGLLGLVDGSQHSVGTLAVSAVWVGQVGSHIYLVRLNLVDELDDRCDVGLGHRQLLNLTTLVERQVEEVDVLAVDTIVFAGQTGLAATDQTFESQYLLVVEVALLLILDKRLDSLVRVLDNLVAAVSKDGVETVDKMHESVYLLVANGDIARCLVGNMHIVVLLHESADGATHRDDIVVGVGREHDDSLGIWGSALGSGAIVDVGFATRPSGDGVLQLIENLDIYQSGLTVELLDQVA